MNTLNLFEDLLPNLKIEIFDKLPHYLNYHNYYHTAQVVNASMKLAKEAQLSQNDKEILYAAAALHDTGYYKRYSNNEAIAATLAEKILPNYGFSAERIAQVSQMILATNLVVEPLTQLEKFLSDADIAYLGQPEFMRRSDDLLNEWREVGQFAGSDEDWLLVQRKFVAAHKFYTPQAEALFGAQKAKNLMLLQQITVWPK